MPVEAIWVAVAYLVGSVSFGLLIAKRRGVDLRSIGSGNIGATNVGRALGKRTGRVVMLLDMLKGFVPTAAAAWNLGFGFDGRWIAATGFAAAFGHCYPLWHGFRGGKAAATSGGVLLAAIPEVGVLTVLTFFVARKLSGRASVGSLLSSALATLATYGLYGTGWRLALAGSLFALVAVRHRSNIVRLLRGTEPRT